MSEHQDPLESYLFDPAAPPAGEIVELERALAPLRHRPHPLPSSALARRRPWRRWLAAAAVVVVAAAAAGAAWLWSWPVGRPWRVLAGPAATLPVGQELRLPPGEDLLVRVARIGWLRAAAGSDLTLLATASNSHRLELRAGSVWIRVWAPPGSLSVRTPAGEVIDFGCEFLLTASHGHTTVETLSGWVQLDNWAGETMVPAGATASMEAGRPPGVAVFTDAPRELRAAVAALEAGDREALPTVVAGARERDVLTLLTLAARLPELAPALAGRAAELAPPSSPDLLARARRGDSSALWDWIDELPLAPAKSWLPNWRDRLGRPAGG